jgi:2-polyprenyl-3-methyl-5-hydroxy-6-metoxy-1,4-benzoquinol methylase
MALTVRELRERVTAYRAGAAVSMMTLLGDRLGLYEAMRGVDAMDADDLGRRTGLHPRWLREWLLGQAAAELLERTPDGRFRLSDEAAAVLVDDGSPSSLIGLFATLPAHMEALGDAERAFATGVGGARQPSPEGVRAAERQRSAWITAGLLPSVLPELDGVLAKLEAGARVADVGCGGGMAVVELARAYPHSRFHAYDVSPAAVAEAEAKRRRAALDNVEVRVADASALPGDDGPFDLVLTLDCMHEMPDPSATAAAIRRALDADGTWLIEELRTTSATGPLAAMLYAGSVLTCLPAGLAGPGGAGLGALGFTAGVAAEVAASAGFTRCRPIEVGYSLYHHVEVRP